MLESLYPVLQPFVSARCVKTDPWRLVDHDLLRVLVNRHASLLILHDQAFLEQCVEVRIAESGGVVRTIGFQALFQPFIWIHVAGSTHYRNIEITGKESIDVGRVFLGIDFCFDTDLPKLFLNDDRCIGQELVLRPRQQSGGETFWQLD